MTAFDCKQSITTSAQYSTDYGTTSEYNSSQTYSYPVSSALGVAPYTAVSYSAADQLSSVPAYPVFQATSSDVYYQHGIQSQDHRYSPHSQLDNIAPPKLSTSSESGASVQSTSSSAITSPHLQPQLQVESWTLPQRLDNHDMKQHAELFFATTQEQDRSACFVGESLSLSPCVTVGSVFRPSPPPLGSTIRSFERYSPYDQSRKVTQLHQVRKDEESFKSPGLPASAMNFRRSSASSMKSLTVEGEESEIHPRRRPYLLTNSSYPTSDQHLESDRLAFDPRPSLKSEVTTPFEASIGSHICLRQSDVQLLTSNKMIDPSEVVNQYATTQVSYPYPTLQIPNTPYFEPLPRATSPAPSNSSSSKLKSPRQSSYNVQPYHPYSYPAVRRQSVCSTVSQISSRRSGSFEVDETDRERGICPIPDCGRSFKDLKAHMLTHQNERPEKCPIQSCEYHVKGFARKYDKNRHTLTHYKGTMVCGFCPGSGSSGEKTFNRADVFKRHLTSVHGVEQVPPNARRKSPMAKKLSATQSRISSGTGGSGSASPSSSRTTGRCSTCSRVFPNAQEFYEHLDDCVLRVVQQIEPSEAINEKHLTHIIEDKEVRDTLEKHSLPATDSSSTKKFKCDKTQSVMDEEDVGDEDGDGEGDEYFDGEPIHDKDISNKGAGTAWCSSSLASKSATATVSRKTGRAGLTYSKGGIPRATAPSSLAKGGPLSGLSARKKRKQYPAAWGSASADKMKMKKRVLCVYDGQRRLCKDDMMLDGEFEVRVLLPIAPTQHTTDTDSVNDIASDSRENVYITDLDIQTLKRADAIFTATEEERGPWIPDNIADVENPDGVFV